MTSTVKNIKVGNTSYPVQDTKATPFLSSADETTLLSNGTYRGETVTTGTIFTKPDGTLNEYASALGDPTISWLTGADSIQFPSGAWDVAYSNGVYVAVGMYNSNACRYSTDGGVTWNSSTLPSSSHWRVATNGNGRWVATAQSGASGGAYSTNNGETWTQSTGGAIRTAGNVVYGGGTFLMLGYDGLSYTTDGITWTGSNPAAYNNWWAVYDPTRQRFVLFSSGNTTVRASSNGASWATLGTSPFSNNGDSTSRLACYGDGVILLFRRESSRVCRSIDGGETWTELNNLPIAGQWYETGYINGTFYVSTNSADRTILLSQDNGETWTIARKDFNNVIYFQRSLVIGDKIIYYPSRGNYSASGSATGTLAGSVTRSLNSLSYNRDETDALIPLGYLTGSSDPTIQTKGAEGQRYHSTSTDSSYINTGTQIGTSTAYYTVVGSPTISNHVVSGFSTSSYLTGPAFTWASTTSSKWSVELKYTYNSSVNNNQTLFQIGPFSGGSDNRLMVVSGALRPNFTSYGGPSYSTNTYDLTLWETGVTYKIKVVYTGTQMQLFCVRDGNDFPDEPTVYWTGTGSVTNTGFSIGCRGSDYLRQGSIDMSSFIIKSNGVEVWRGADATPIEYQWKQLAYKDEAGTPVLLATTDPTTTTVGLLGQRLLNTVSGSSFVCNGVYVPEEYISNYTVNGSPTISSAQVLSNCSANNYITGSQLFDCATSASSTWAIETEITLPSGSLSGRQHYMAIGTGDHILIQEGSYLYWSMVNWGVAFESSNMRHSVTAGKTYTMRMEYDGTNLNWYISDDGTIPSTPTYTYTASGTKVLAAGNSIYFGTRPAYSSQYAQGSINLMKTKIYASGSLYWEAVTTVEEVPAEWTELQNSLTAGDGITITNSGEISLITPYEVVQTMPASPTAGKVYFLESSTAAPVVVETYSNGAFWYRLWSDGWCEQGGETAIPSNQTKVYLNTPFLNTNYTLALGGNDPDDNVYVIASAWYTKAADGFVVVSGLNNNFYAFTLDWYACGYVS